MDELREKLVWLHAEAADRRATGNPTGAMARYLQCISICEETAEPRKVAAICLEVADMHYDLYDLAEATRWYERGEAGFVAVGDLAMASRCRLGLGKVELLKGDYAAAIAIYAGELDRILEQGDSYAEGLARIGLGQALCDSGAVTRGVPELEAGLNCLTASGAPEAAEAARVLKLWTAPARQMTE